MEKYKEDPHVFGLSYVGFYGRGYHLFVYRTDYECWTHYPPNFGDYGTFWNLLK